MAIRLGVPWKQGGEDSFSAAVQAILKGEN